jgi:hypothetical protein
MAYTPAACGAASCGHGDTQPQQDAAVSFGALFTLRQRARRARPGAADEAFPDTAGWIERREKPDRRGAKRAASGRRASDRRPPGEAPR